jgi:hypothetical protein
MPGLGLERHRGFVLGMWGVHCAAVHGVLGTSSRPFWYCLRVCE